jgi:RNA polymerase-binding transcription factor DksA
MGLLLQKPPAQLAAPLIHLKPAPNPTAHTVSMHYHYLTIEQREALERRLRASLSGRALQAALQRLHQPDYGVCIECGKDIAFVRLEADPDALHCGACARLPIKR